MAYPWQCFPEANGCKQKHKLSPVAKMATAIPNRLAFSEIPVCGDSASALEGRVLIFLGKSSFGPASCAVNLVSRAREPREVASIVRLVQCVVHTGGVDFETHTAYSKPCSTLMPLLAGLDPGAKATRTLHLSMDTRSRECHGPQFLRTSLHTAQQLEYFLSVINKPVPLFVAVNTSIVKIRIPSILNAYFIGIFDRFNIAFDDITFKVVRKLMLRDSSPPCQGCRRLQSDLPGTSLSCCG